MRVTLSGPSLPVRTCARRLKAFGAWEPVLVATDASDRTLTTRLGPADDERLGATISWHGPAKLGAQRPASEVTIQALSGLMAVHGRDAGQPRRLGLEVASVASGLLATHAILAALVGRSRGRPIAAVETSVLEAALVLVCHYVAGATCPTPDEWSPPAKGPDPGPPFRSAEGRWFEIETLEPEAWKQFWSQLGAADADLGQAWTAFRARYFRGRCTLPTGLQQATARHSLEQLTAAAAACRVSLSVVRSPEEVIAEPGAGGGHPRIEPLGDEPAGTLTDAGGGGNGLPLQGIEVVEATSRMQGPLAGLLLQMLGAHVVRIEPPGGDPIRLVAPYAGNAGYFFEVFNRGKDALELDLAARSDRTTLLELATGADVFLHNWRPGKASEWGADPQTLAARNPRLTYVRASGWGDAQRNRRLLGTDFLVQAYAGIGYGLHPEGEPPAPSRVLLTDCLGALVTCEGALGGLLSREQTGRGCEVDASLLAGAMTLQADVLDAMVAGRENGRRQGRPVWGLLDSPLPSADGFIAIDPDGRATSERLCQVCGVDPRAGSRLETDRAVAEHIRGGPSLGWEEELCDAAIPCAAVCTDLGAPPLQPRLEPLFEQLSGTCRAPAAPWRFSSGRAHTASAVTT